MVWSQVFFLIDTEKSKFCFQTFPPSKFAIRFLILSLSLGGDGLTSALRDSVTRFFALGFFNEPSFPIP